MKSIIINDIAKTVYQSLKNSDEAAKARIGATLLDTLKRKGHMQYATRIVEAIEQLYDSDAGIVNATVTVKEPLSESQKKDIQKMLKEKYQAHEIRIHETIDESVLGGIKITVGEEVYNATLKHTLATLQKQLQA